MTMREKINLLNYHTELYNQGKAIWSDKEWDELYFTLKKEEEESGIIYPDSPTQNIYYSLVDKIHKTTHEHPMLSLDKTKNLKEVNSFLHGQPFVAMFKMDGISCSLTYDGGELIKAETRGNGYIGEDITHNVQIIKNVPYIIPFKDKLVIDGEIICRKDDFLEFENDFKNPRNFAAGSIRLLNSEECEKRKLSFIAWDLIEGYSELNEFWTRLIKLKDLGFTVVPFTIQKKTPEEAIKTLEEQCQDELHIYPMDGYVFKFDNIEYGKSQGQTEHHFKNAIAYKLYDEIYETTVKNIEWTMGRTGQLTPVLIYDDINIEGSICNRANLHNITIMTQLMGGAYPGQKVFIYKANQIIPQVNSAQIDNPNNIPLIQIPKKCPFCGKPTIIKKDFDSEVLYCSNEKCNCRLINRLEHFYGKKGLDVKGISKATFEKLIEWEWIQKIEDVFYLKNYKNDWIKKPGFGEKSVTKILTSIEEGKKTTLNAFISALGIPLIGQNISKEISNYFKTYNDFKNAVTDCNFNFTKLNNFGIEMNNSLKNFDYSEADKLYTFLTFEIKEEKTLMPQNLSLPLNGKNIVITGKLIKFKNRNELKELIKYYGGKVSDTVTSKTDILINNDVNSTSSKNLKAKELGIQILSEQDFMTQYIEN